MIDPRACSRRHHAEAIQLLVLLGSCVLLVAVPMAYFALKARHSWSAGSERVQFGAAAAAALVVGGGMLLQARRLHRRILPLFRWVEETPHLVVWVYTETHSYRTAESASGPGRITRWITTVGVGLEDGRFATLIAEGETAGAEIVDFISGRAPHATRGFSLALQKRFREAPGTFRRDVLPPNLG